MCVQMFPSEMPGLSWQDPSRQLFVFFQGRRTADGFSRVKRSLGDSALSSVGGCNLAPEVCPLLQVHLWGATVIQRVPSILIGCQLPDHHSGWQELSALLARGCSPRLLGTGKGAVRVLARYRFCCLLFLIPGE